MPVSWLYSKSVAIIENEFLMGPRVLLLSDRADSPKSACFSLRGHLPLQNQHRHGRLYRGYSLLGSDRWCTHRKWLQDWSCEKQRNGPENRIFWLFNRLGILHDRIASALQCCSWTQVRQRIQKAGLPRHISRHGQRNFVLRAWRRIHGYSLRRWGIEERTDISCYCYTPLGWMHACGRKKAAELLYCVNVKINFKK